MSGGEEEPNRVLGIARRDVGPRARRDEEARRVLGFPVGGYSPDGGLQLRSIRHPVKAYKRWALIRRLGPYAPEDGDDLTPTG